MRNRLTVISLLGLLTFLSPFAKAQQEPGAGGADNTNYEIGFHLGNLLPNQIAGVTEITGVGGVRAGVRLAPLSFAEAGFITGNGDGVQWKNAHLDLRMDIPVENLVGLAYIGADTVFYKGNTGGSRLIFGGHAGGGLHTQVAGNLWFRGDMKFSFSPGTSLYVGFGLEFRM